MNNASAKNPTQGLKMPKNINKKHSNDNIVIFFI